MKEILLSNSAECVVVIDDDDFELVAPHRWMLMCVRNLRYALTHIEKKPVLMHRLIMNPPTELVVDHKDTDGLNNQRDNLRVVTRGQNGLNRRIHKNNKSGYKGVTAQADCSTFRVQLRIGGKRVLSKNFPTAIEAARAYNEAAKQYHGEFARLNEGID